MPLSGAEMLPWSLSSWPTFAQRERGKKSAIPLGMTEKANSQCTFRPQGSPSVVPPALSGAEGSQSTAEEAGLKDQRYMEECGEKSEERAGQARPLQGG